MTPKKNDPRLRNSLLSIIAMMQHKAEDRGLRPVITIAKLQQLLEVAGVNVTYQQLVDLSKDPAIAPSIKSINRNQIVLNLGDEEPQEPDSASTPPPPPADDNSIDSTEWIPDESDSSNETTDTFDEPEEPVQQRKSIISQMAKRAASRAD